MSSIKKASEPPGTMESKAPVQKPTPVDPKTKEKATVETAQNETANKKLLPNKKFKPRASAKAKPDPSEARISALIKSRKLTPAETRLLKARNVPYFEAHLVHLERIVAMKFADASRMALDAPVDGTTVSPASSKGRVPKIGPQFQEPFTDQNKLSYLYQYKAVHVLLLKWTDDDSGAGPIRDKLKSVFATDYLFDSVSVFDIPSTDSDTLLYRRLLEFLKERSSKEHLLIIWYGGHGIMSKENKNKLFLADVRTNPCCLDWYALQLHLANAVSDVLLLMDCCNAGAAANVLESDLKYYGRKRMEIIAASTYDQYGYSHAFTQTLILELLRRAKNSDAPIFSTSELFQELVRQSIHGVESSTCKLPIHASRPSHQTKQCWYSPGHLYNILLRPNQQNGPSNSENNQRPAPQITIAQTTVAETTAPQTSSRTRTKSSLSLVKRIVSWRVKVSFGKRKAQKSGDQSTPVIISSNEDS